MIFEKNNIWFHWICNSNLKGVNICFYMPKLNSCSWKTEKLVSPSRTSVSQYGMKMFRSVSSDVFCSFSAEIHETMPIDGQRTVNEMKTCLQKNISFHSKPYFIPKQLNFTLSREIGRKEKFQRISPRIGLIWTWVDSFEGIDAESGYRGGGSPFGNTKL